MRHKNQESRDYSTKMAFSAILELPRRFVSFINRLLHGWDTLSEDVGDESADESDWSSEDESSSKRVRNEGGHRKARRGKSRKDRKQKDAKSDEKQKSKSPDEKAESTPVASPSAPMTRLAEVLSSKEGLKSAALKASARDEVDGKSSDERDCEGAKGTTVIKIKPPPPTAPKPRAQKNSQSGDEAGDKKPAAKEVKTSHGSTDDCIFGGLDIARPKLLTSYKRTMGPQGRRLPQRYSNHVQSQRFSNNQSTNALTTVSA